MLRLANGSIASVKAMPLQEFLIKVDTSATDKDLDDISVCFVILVA